MAVIRSFRVVTRINTYFLVDGIERNSISNLTPDPMAFFAVTDIERIEFVHWPGSTMYAPMRTAGFSILSHVALKMPGIRSGLRVPVASGIKSI